MIATNCNIAKEADVNQEQWRFI